MLNIGSLLVLINRIFLLILILLPVPLFHHFNHIENRQVQHLMDIPKKIDSPNSLPSLPELDSLGLTVSSGDSHEYVLTNRDKLHWTGETSKVETRKWQGLVKDRWTTMTNFWLDTTGETTPSNVINTTVFPHAVKTVFNTGSGKVEEIFFLARNRNAMIIQYQTDFSGTVSFRPQFGMRRDWAASGSDYHTEFNTSNNILFISTNDESYIGPEYVGIKSSTAVTFIQNEKIIPRTYEKDDYRGDGSNEENVYEPGQLIFSISPSDAVFIVIGLGNKKTDLITLLEDAVANYLDWWIETTQPLVDILTNSQLCTNNETWNKVLQWTLMSLDSLTMNVTGRGIYAGLHWFPEYWGRDSFISFPGSVLVTGQFELAKSWIRTMIANQDTNPSSSTYGRVPNILQVNVQNLNYETTDGTGWFIRSIWEYFEYSGFDDTFLTEVWPAVETAILGEISRTDEYGFLTHGDRETWMDAQTGGVICSPRGNRAVEIQALFYTELDIGRRLAKMMDQTVLANQWEQKMVFLKENFLLQFWDPIGETLFDHLNDDGTPDLQKRPNVIFAVTVPLIDNPLLSPYQAKKVLDDVLAQCIAPHGVRSLAETDPDYHPLHDYGSRTGSEHHDFSYHNGDVWLWLSGPVIEASVRYGNQKAARNLIEVLVNRVLTRDALGTLGEIMDGTDSDPLGHSRGTISQAWSLAELLRTYYQYWVGIQPQAINRTLRLTPQFLEDFPEISLIFKQNEGIIEYSYQNVSGELFVDLNFVNFSDPLTLEIDLPLDPIKGTPFLIDGISEYRFEPVFDGIQLRYSIKLEDFLSNNKSFRISYNGTKPIFEITQPLENITYNIGEPIPFLLINLSDKPFDEVKWSSDLDGIIGTINSFERSDLSPGRHLITVMVTNNEGVSFKQIIVSIGNSAPLARIRLPKNGSTVSSQKPVHFQADAKDNNPDDIVQVYWISNIDGQIFSELNGSITLSQGDHVISVIFTDGKANVSYVIFLTVISQRINLDGNLDDWSDFHPGENTLELTSGEFIWLDAIGDDTGDGDYVYPSYNLPWSADLLRVQITSDTSYLYFLVTFNRPETTDWAQRMASVMVGLNLKDGGIETVTTIFASSHPLSIAINPSIAPEIIIFATAQAEISVRDTNNQ
ncbi:MAG: hypothetical protein JSV04_00835, partial [Candidatus Heimdallarchaeota archaeon]